ncbi:hypothetical protein Y032_0236g3208 [Ancylostoma ceylanicum]|uniref:Uncharacterized protein n=1 Tax=Ancylostoma ceylanicum TaxID=53326 RepID=A0A016SFM9_9BILA|nr:hypothetical protein Y032_0236g3208 [Ancylostoma ceylanicum]
MAEPLGLGVDRDGNESWFVIEKRVDRKQKHTSISCYNSYVLCSNAGALLISSYLENSSTCDGATFAVFLSPLLGIQND